VSLGYLREVEHKPGISPAGEPYDYVRTRIVPNHVAVVDVARAGRQARLALDSAPELRPWQRPLAASKGSMPAAITDDAPTRRPWEMTLAERKAAAPKAATDSAQAPKPWERPLAANK
jgi:hypothetical protein